MEMTDPISLEFEKALLHINRMRSAEIFEKCYSSEKGFSRTPPVKLHTFCP